MTRSILIALSLIWTLSSVLASVNKDSIRIDAQRDAILLNSSNARMVGDLIPNGVYTVTVTGNSTAPMQGVFFMLSNPTAHDFRYVPFGTSFTFVPINGPFQLAAFYVDWSSSADNSGSITVNIAGPTTKTLTIDPKSNCILLDDWTPRTIKKSTDLTANIPFVVSVRDSAVSGTPVQGAFFMYQESNDEFGFRYVPAGQGFIFTPKQTAYQIAAIYVDWSDKSDNSGEIIVDLVARQTISRTIRLDEKNHALLLTSANAKIVGDLTPNQAYTVTLASTASAPMKGAFFMMQTPTEHDFRYVNPGESFTFVPIDSSIQLAAFYVDWSDLSDNSGVVTVTIKDTRNEIKKTLTLDAKADAILLDNITPVQTGLIPGAAPQSEWVVSVRDSGVTGTRVNGAYFMYLSAGTVFHFKYIPPSGAIIFKPLYPTIYQIAPFLVDWSTTSDNTGRVIVEFSGPQHVTAAKAEQTPTDFALEQNFPNPFNPSTTIRFSIPTRSHVILQVFNSIGQRVATLLNKELTAGSHDIRWDAAAMTSGVYFYRLQTESFVQTRALTLMK